MKAAILLVVSGCSLGAGNPYVGRWTAHSHVDVDACLVDEHDACRERRQIVGETPAKRFGGAILTIPAVGVARVDRDGAGSTEPRAELGVEAVLGRGGDAWGLEASVTMDHDGWTLPVALVRHRSITDHLGVFGGGGYVPAATIDNMTTHVGARALAGAQLAFTFDPELVLSVQADATWLDLPGGYVSRGLTAHLGWFF